MRPPLAHPTFPSTKWALALLILVLWAALLMQCSAATVVFGNLTHREFSAAPLGTTSGGTASYVGQYQQIYASSAFQGASFISQIAFSSYYLNDPGDVNYVLSIGLGVTTRTPTNPGTGFSREANPLFSATFVAYVTSDVHDWDIIIDLPTPFLYDSTLGNLLLDVNVTSASGRAAMATWYLAGQGIVTVAEISKVGTSINSLAGYGQVTQFTVTPVPEPVTAALLFLGAVVCVRRRGRGKVAILIASSLGAFICDNGRAATIIAGKERKVQTTVFSTYGVPYVGPYQQIYDRNLFSSPSAITQIGFRSIGPNGGYDTDVMYNLSVGLGLTERTPSSPGSGFATGATTVFSGPLPVHITASNLDFDLLIPLTTPFLYDPALGNLLLDITLVSAGQTPPNLPVYTFLYDNAATDIATIRPHRIQGTVAVLPNEGIVTKFTVVPEAATAALLFLGAAVCIPRRGRAPLLSS